MALAVLVTDMASFMIWVMLLLKPPARPRSDVTTTSSIFLAGREVRSGWLRAPGSERATGCRRGEVGSSGGSGAAVAAGQVRGRDSELLAYMLWGALLALGLVLSLLCIIRLEYNYKSLLVLRAHLGTEPGRWKPVYMDFVKIWLATVAVFIVSALAMGALLAALAGGSFALFAGQTQRMGLWLVVVIFVAIVGGIFLLLLASAPARAYREARMFQLMWSNVGVSQVARFKCQLGTGRYVLLRLKNMLLTLLTLGLYRPFARVSEYRMKFESVTLHIKGGVDQIAGILVRQQQGGLGDALADAAGLDLIG